MASKEETLAMKKALKLAHYGKGNTFPNPMVGAVVLDSEGNHAGDGFHRKCGAPHAETVALSSAGDATEGGTLVVTLEPCCHEGRTGPCTQEIIESKVARVVIAMEDPDPRVNGKGVEQLEKADIEVEVGLLSKEAQKLNRVYLHYHRESRSWLTLKMAMSLDGRIAAADGSSKWISCDESRKHVHRKRASVQAIMTGAGTVRKDDPRLTVRLEDIPPGGQPCRIVVSSTCDFGGSKNLFTGKGRVVVAVPEGRDLQLPEYCRKPSVEVWELPATGDSGGVDLKELLKRTAAEGIGEILCEAGGSLASLLLKQKLVDSVSIFTSPILLGADGIPAFRSLGVETIDKAVRLKNFSFKRSGSDFLTEGEIVYGSD